MVDVPIALGNYKRSTAGFPEVVLENLVAEKTPMSQTKGVTLIGKPGLDGFVTAESLDLGNGPIRGVFRRAGLFDGDAIIISGEDVYRVTEGGVVTQIPGVVAGVDRVDMDGGQNLTTDPVSDEVRVANGDAGTGPVLIAAVVAMAETFPDDAPVSSVAQIRGFWFALRKDTQQVYVKEPGEPAWTALSATSAERQPDKLVALRPLGDTLLLMGEETIEPWELTGQADPAIAPITAAAVDVGLFARDSAVRVGSSLCFVGSDFVAYEWTTYPRPIGDPALSEQIRMSLSADVRAWTLSLDQHKYYALRLGNNGTHVWDQTSGFWPKWSSLGLNYWRPHLGAQLGGSVIAADSNSAALWKVNPDSLTDDGDPIVRTFSAIFQLDAGTAECNSVAVNCAVGFGPEDGSAPSLGMRFRDGAGPWTDWSWQDLGPIGRYDARPVWWRMGDIKPPGRMFQFQTSDEVIFRADSVQMNAED